MNLDMLAVDVSKYQDRIVGTELKDGGVGLVIVRAAGGLTEDPKFKTHIESAIKSNLMVAVYAWDDPNITSKRQVDKWLSIIEPYKNYIKFFSIDAEQWWSVWGEWYQAIRQELAWNLVQRFNPAKLSIHYESTFLYLSSLWDNLITIYTSTSFVKGFAPNMKNWLVNTNVWLAEYGYQPEKKTVVSWEDVRNFWLPKYTMSTPGGNIVGHQFTGDKLLLPGMYTPYNALSPADVNLFSSEWLNASPVIPPVIELPDPLYKGTVKANALNVRNSPSISGRIVGSLTLGEEVDIFDTYKDRVWYKISPTEELWVAGNYGKELVEIK